MYPSLTRPETTKFYQLSRQVYVDFVGNSLIYRNKPFHFDSPNLLLNYLCVINPLHKDAIRSITLQVRLRKTATKLPDNALLFLNSCKSLQHFNLQILAVEELFVFQPVVAAQPAMRPRTPKFSMQRKVLDGMMQCESLRSIKGLKTFDLEFILPERLGYSASKETVGLKKFIEEMRELMVKKE